MLFYLESVCTDTGLCSLKDNSLREIHLLHSSCKPHWFVTEVGVWSDVGWTEGVRVVGGGLGRHVEIAEWAQGAISGWEAAGSDSKKHGALEVL